MYGTLAIVTKVEESYVKDPSGCCCVPLCKFESERNYTNYQGFFVTQVITDRYEVLDV